MGTMSNNAYTIRTQSIMEHLLCLSSSNIIHNYINQLNPLRVRAGPCGSVRPPACPGSRLQLAGSSLQAFLLPAGRGTRIAQPEAKSGVIIDWRPPMGR